MADDASTPKDDSKSTPVSETIPVVPKATTLTTNDRPDKNKQAAIDASNASLKDYDPDKVADKDKIAELWDHSSHVIKDLVKHANSVVADDARRIVEEVHPGGKNYPNGPSK